MEMTTPSQDVVLPADIQKAIEAGRNQITMLQAECDRLKGLIDSYNYTIGQLHNSKNEYESKISELQKQSDELKLAIKILTDENNTKLAEYKNLEDSKKHLEGEISSKNIELDNKQNKLNSDIVKYNEDKALLDTERALVESEARELNDKINKLKAIIG